MTTTLSYLQGGGSRVGFVIAIEGYEYLLVQGLTEATAAQIFNTGTGWAGTDWSQALSGLSYVPTITRRLTPWSSKTDVPTISFAVQGGIHSDRFGIDLHKIGGGNQTELTAALTASGTAAITVASSADYAASGDLYIGTERIGYTSKPSASSFGGTITRGKFSPFGTKSGTANRFGRTHDLPSVNFDVQYRPRVTDAPRTWIGREVGVWCHAIRGGVWDTKANARLVFAGRLTGHSDTANGSVVIECEDIASKLRGTTLLRDQFRGRVADGLRVSALGADTKAAQAFTINTGLIQSSILTVVTGAVSSTSEIGEGYYTAEEICSIMTEWLANDATIQGKWEIAIVGTSEGLRTQITVDMQGAGFLGHTLLRFAIPRAWAAFLGFTGYPAGDGGSALWYDTRVISLPDIAGGGSGTLVSQLPPARVVIDLADQVALDGSQGTWIDEDEWLPQSWQDDYVNAGDSWGVLQVGEKVYALARQIDAVTFELRESEKLTEAFGGDSFDAVNNSITSSEGGSIEVRQVVVLEGSFKEIIERLMYSTGSADYNATTLDEWPEQLGAGIPGELLGTAFEDSVSLLTEASAQASMRVVLEKPTRLEDVIGTDLLMRSAFLSWDSGLVMTTLSPIVSALAAHTISESSKRAGISGDAQVAGVTTSRAHIRNIVKIEFNRDLSADREYKDRISAFDVASAQRYGERPVTIRARNSYAQQSASGDSIQAIAGDIIGAVMPAWRDPVLVMTHTIPPSMYQGVKLGDIVSVSDSHARNPGDGTRGMSGKPGRIIGHTYSFGGSDLSGGSKPMLGEVTVAFAATDDEVIYSPAGRVASYADPSLTLEAHAFTTATEAVDASFFAADDEVLIVERDPTDPAAAQSWQPSIVSVAGNVINVGTLVGYDAAKSYVIMPASFGTVMPSQAVTAYQADDVDMQIENSRQPYVWGQLFNGGSFSGIDGTDKPEVIPTLAYGDGVALSPHQHRAAAEFLANFIRYKSAMHIPWVYTTIRTAPTIGVGAGAFTHIETRPISIGVGEVSGQAQRKWSVAPQMRSSVNSYITKVRVTFSRTPPALGGGVDITFAPPYKQLTFQSTSSTYAIITSQSVEPVVNHFGEGYITIEGLSDTVNLSQMQLRGFPTFYLGL